ncbi:MAG: hypothetical protein ACRD03_09535, partial [Acidimicrobiales bacterium]
MSEHTPSARGPSRRLLLAAVVLTLLAAVVGACGDGDSDGRATSATPATGDVDSQEHDGPVNPCAPDAPADATALEGDPASATANIVEVTAVDHEFQGVDASYPAGDYGFRMTNRGREAHEMAMIRVNDGETRSVEELLDLPEDEAEQVTHYIGGSVACPGETAETLGVQMTPGRYMLLCFIPTGLTPDVPSSEAAFEELGPPHFAQGMVTEIRGVRLPERDVIRAVEASRERAMSLPVGRCCARVASSGEGDVGVV